MLKTDETKTETKTVEKSKTILKTIENKMSVLKYLQDYPQNTYFEALLKKKYALQFKTKTEWDNVVETEKNKKINK